MKGKVKFLSGDRQLYQNFKLGHIIGTGNSIVFQAVSKQGKLQCVKQIILSDSQNQFIFRKQVQLLQKLKQNQHENIVKCRGSYCLQQAKGQFGTIKKGYIQMQKGITNLQTFIKHRTNNNFDEKEILSFIRNMLDVFAHLQKIEIAHRDIKPSNLLIFSQDPLQIKVCDIGAGTAVGYCDSTKQRTVIGTPYYLSPELHKAYQDKLGNVKNNPYKSDMYSLGLVFIQFCLLKRYQGRFDQNNTKLQQIIQKIKQKYPNIIGLGKILRKMLAYNVSDRFDFIEMQKFIIENDYLRSKIDNSAKLDSQLKKQLSSSSQVTLQGVDKLPDIQNLISTGSRIYSLKINISNNIMPLKANQLQLFQELKKLRYLELQDLSITVQLCGIGDKQAKMIAEGIQKNKHLRQLRLNLWNNSITNQGFKYILSAIKTSLKFMNTMIINISNNQVVIDKTYESFFDFSQGQDLINLSIDLSFNEIQPQFLSIISSDIAKCNSLRMLEFSLQRVNTNPVHFKKAIKLFEKLENIEELRINTSCNTIRQEGMFALADLCAKVQKLTKYTLIIRNSEINDKGFTEFVKTLAKQAKNLQELKLNFLSNEITEKGTKNVAEYLERFSLLQEIDLNFSHNKLQDGGVKNACKSILEIKTLKKVRLAFDWCTVTQKGCLYIGRMISQLPQLRQLDISLKHNQIEYKGVQYISVGLLQGKKIKKLRIILEGTYVGDYAANYLARCLLKCRRLTNVDLNLDSCNLTQETMSNILGIVKQYSKKADQITIHMRKNRSMNQDLYEKIKKELNDSRVAIRIDHPQDPNSPGIKLKAMDTFGVEQSSL